MPELPEVETIRRALSKHLPGREITRVAVRDRRLRWPVPVARLKRLVLHRPIGDIDRRAKYLLIDLRREAVLILHLGMTGKLLLLRGDPPFEKHDHVIFHLDDGSQLRLRDPRRFGMVDAITRSEVPSYLRFINLGVEPLAKSTRPKQLFERAHKLSRPIKNLLMDGNFIVGVGNIYANEALFYARVHPARPANSLSLQDWQSLLTAIRRVLNKAIKKGGTTLNDFVNSDGEMGYFQLSLAVYGRGGAPCPKCRTSIEKFVQVGRSTYFCPNCQVLQGSR